MSIVKQHIPLASYTTIKLGGHAAYFANCSTVDDIQEALAYAQKHHLRVHVLGGGSNTVFSDNGFDGLVIHVNIRGVSFESKSDYVFAAVQAGEVWDDFAAQCVERNFSGIECLSGIPGTVGATPVQNVGAYGQEVSDVIAGVQAVDMNTFELVDFSHDECEFGYRTSRFKKTGAYVVVNVTYKLMKSDTSIVQYPQLQESIGEEKRTLAEIRHAVLELRKSKSMVFDPNDACSISCGSFFVHPVLSLKEFTDLCDASTDDIPSFPAGDDAVKVPAAWLIKHAGFEKGYMKGKVGISPHHILSLVNYGGTTQELLELARDIQDAVKKKFNIDLVLEPVVVD